MNALHYSGSLKERSVLVSLVWVGMVSGLVGCGSNLNTHGGMTNLGQTPTLQSGGNAPAPSIAGPNGTVSVLPVELTVTAITHLMTIETDIAGRATLPVYFNLELMVDSSNSIQMINVHRQGTTRPALPQIGPVTAADRARICDENSKASQENCDVDVAQLAQEGVVVERFLGRPGVILKAAPGFSAENGGRITMTYIQKAGLADSAQDVLSHFAIVLEHRNSQWLLYAAGAPEKGPFSLMKLDSEFSGLFATGVKSIEVGTSDSNLW